MIKYAVFLLALFCSTQSFCEETRSEVIDILDCECSGSNNPLKGISSFTVLIPDQSPESELFIKELEKIGKIKKFSLTDPTGIDFEGMGTGSRLSFFLTSLTVKGNSKLTIKRITLCLGTSIEILKTKHRIDSYVWLINQFSTEDSVGEAIKSAARQFIVSYQQVNPSSLPMFYIYQ